MFEVGRARVVSALARWTPVVWTGGPNDDKLPNKSVNPPRAVRLVRALSAPGFASNCASGMAEANAAALCVPSADVTFVGVVVVTPDTAFVDDAVVGVPLVGDAPDCSCAKFAFCNSTLLGRR